MLLLLLSGAFAFAPTPPTPTPVVVPTVHAVSTGGSSYSGDWKNILTERMHARAIAVNEEETMELTQLVSMSLDELCQ